MSDATTTQDDDAGLLDAPNQQVVRPDGSHPADEGEGGSGAEQPKRRRSTAKSEPPPSEPTPETTTAVTESAS